MGPTVPDRWQKFRCAPLAPLPAARAEGRHLTKKLIGFGAYVSPPW
jgi:hypothetical protein